MGSVYFTKDQLLGVWVEYGLRLGLEAFTFGHHASLTTLPRSEAAIHPEKPSAKATYLTTTVLKPDPEYTHHS